MVYKPTFTSLGGAQTAIRRQEGGDWWLQVRKMQLQVAFFSVFFSDFRIDFGVENGGS